MLFQKSLLRELRSTSGGVLAVLLTTLVTMILIRALGRAASGRVDGELVVPLIVFNTLNLMSTVLMLTVYISVFMVLSRWWRDSEMVIWLSSGKSLVDFLKPVWKFMWPMILLVAMMSTVVAPWSKQQIAAFEDEIQNRSDAQRVSPGQFRESYSGQRVFFLENPDDDGGRTGSVFIRSIDANGRQSVLVSSTGKFEKDLEGQQWIVLERGYRTDLMPGYWETQTTGFEVYRFRIDHSARGVKSEETIRSTPTMALFERTEPVAQGELALRLGLPLLTLGLGILAIPLAVTQARSGRAVNLLLALLIYLIASNLFSALTATVTQGRFSLEMAWWPLPTVLLAIAAAMMWWRMR